MLYVANAFSLGMFESLPGAIFPKELDTSEAAQLLNNNNNKFHSVVGHADTAAIMSELTGISIPYNREALKLNLEDKVLVFQCLERLPEGTVVLPEKIQTKWLLISFISDDVLCGMTWHAAERMEPSQWRALTDALDVKEC